MRLLKLFFYLLFLFLINTNSHIYAQIIISEIMYNNKGEDNNEWIELINLGHPIEFYGGKEGWRLSINNKNHIFKIDKFFWNTNEVIVITKNKEAFNSKYPGINKRIIYSSFNLPNKGGLIKILDKDKNILTSLKYSSNIGGNGNGYSLIFDDNKLRQGNFLDGTPGIYPEPPILNSNNNNINTNNSELKNNDKKKSNEKYIENDKNKNEDDLSSEKLLSFIFDRLQNTKIEPEISSNYKKLGKTETIDNYQQAKYLIINEFLPNNKGKDTNEFVEILNLGDEEIDFDKTPIFLKIGNKKIKLSGKIKPKEFLVIKNSNYKFNIRNNSEELSLIDNNNKEIFYIKYSGKSPQDLSFSRKNNKEWHWTKPTPGEENIFLDNNNQHKINYENNYKGKYLFKGNVEEKQNQGKKFLYTNIFKSNDFLAIISIFFIAVIISFILSRLSLNKE